METFDEFKRKETMDIIHHEFGLDREWQENLIYKMKLFIPKCINNHLIKSDIWFEIVSLGMKFPVANVMIKCSDRVPNKFSKGFSCVFDILDIVNGYDKEYKDDYFERMTEQIKSEITKIVMELIQFLNNVDEVNKGGT